MSGRAVERLIAPLVDHLCGPHSFPAAAGAAESSTDAELQASYHRWRQCFSVWRKVLDSDVVLLALLLHSGCLWAPNYPRLLRAREAAAAALSDDNTRAATASDSTSCGDLAIEHAARVYTSLQAQEPHAVWAANVLRYLNLVEVFAVDTEGPERYQRSSSRALSPPAAASKPPPPRGRGRLPGSGLHTRKRRHGNDGSDPSEDRVAGYGLSTEVIPSPVRCAAVQAHLSTGSGRAAAGRTGGHLSGKTTAGPNACGASTTPEEVLQLLQGCVTVTDSDEPLIQRVASSLVDAWFELVSPTPDDDGSCHAPRAYFFASALKFAAYVDGTHSVLLDENPHLQALLARQAVPPAAAAEIFQATVPSILMCLLAQEVCANGLPQPLRMPPPTYLLPWHALGRDSRVAVWLPAAAPASVPPPPPRSRGRPSAAAVAAAAVTSASPMRGEYLACEVLSEGLQFSSPKGLWMDVAWLDEDTAASTLRAAINDLMPAVPRDTHRDDRHGGGSHRPTGPSPGQSSSPALPREPVVRRHWSAQVQQLLGHMRVDVIAPRTLAMRPIPAKVDLSSEAQKGKARATAATEPLTLLYGTYPSDAVNYLACCGFSLNASMHRTSTAVRQSLQRDAFATVAQFLHLSGRRALSMRELFCTPPPSSSMDGTIPGKVGMGKGLPALHMAEDATASPTRLAPPGDAAGRSAGDDKVSGRAHPAAAASATFRTAPLELEALCAVASALGVTALLLSHNLLDALLDLPQGLLWTTEVTSFVCDVALLPAKPISRFLQGAGFALCLLPSRPQSLLVAVGLFAALGARQVASVCSSLKPTAAASGELPAVHLWWSLFQLHVLRHATIPAQLYPSVWALADDVNRSMPVATRQLGQPTTLRCGESTHSTAASSGSRRTLTLRRARARTASRLPLKASGARPLRVGARRQEGPPVPVPDGGTAVAAATSGQRPAQPSPQSPVEGATSDGTSAAAKEDAAVTSICQVCGPSVVRPCAPYLRLSTAAAEASARASGHRRILVGRATEHRYLFMAAVASLWVSLEEVAASFHHPPSAAV